ncbi:MAG: LysE family transporter [Candidatus Omnitrophica bacterium]|nr:LysE family transporter [Candidatus Omnitrophota bacterium]
MLIGFLSGFLAALLSWRINIVAIQRGVQRGKTAAFFVGVGSLTADVVLILGAFSGARPLTQNQHLWMILKIIGILTILFVAFKIFFQAPKLMEKAEKERNPPKNFLIGFSIVAGNPAVFMLWMGLVSFILTQAQDATQQHFHYEYLAGFFCGGLIWVSLLCFLILPKIRAWGERPLYLISRISAIILIICAIILIFN